MRPRSFDEGAVVERLEAAFWSHGFEGLSLEQLTEATGLSRSSLYNAFGSKSGMMRAAADCYADRSCARIGELLAERPFPAALSRLLRGSAGLDGGDERTRRLGCLIGNLIAERAVDEADRAFLGEKLAQIEAALIHGVSQAGAEGWLAPGADPERLGRFLLVQLQGLRLTARAEPPRDTMIQAVEMAEASLAPHLIAAR